MISLGLQDSDKIILNLANVSDASIRQRILKSAAKTVIKSTKDRVGAQTDIEGKAFGDYSSNSVHTRPRRRKMLARLLRRIATINIDDFSVTIGWKSDRDARIAGVQQFGGETTFKKEWLKAESDGSRKGMAYYKDPATRTQAKALLAAGYKVRRAKGGLWTPSIKWITQNLTIAKAGLILKILRGSQGGDEWTIKNPARPFTGITADDIDVILKAVNAEYQKAMGAA